MSARAWRRWGQLALYASGAAARRRERSVALIVALAFITWLFGAAVLLTDALQREFRAGLSGAPALTVQRLEGGRPALLDLQASETRALMQELEGRRGVRAVRPRVWGYVYLPSLSANLTIVGANELGGGGTQEEAIRREIVEGVLPAPMDARDDSGDEAVRDLVAIGQELAERLGLRVGDQIALPTAGGYHLVHICGVFRSSSALRTADVLLTTPATARTLLGVAPEAAVDLAIELARDDEAAVIASLIPERLPGARVLQRDLLERTYALTFDGRGGMLGALLLPALAALLLITWDRLTALGVAERREIGTLKAIGWQTRDVMLARLMELGILSLSGAALGLAAAYAYVFIFGAPGMARVLFGWSSLYPELTLRPHADAGAALSILGLVVIPFVSVGLLPTFRAAMVDPLDALRGLR